MVAASIHGNVKHRVRKTDVLWAFALPIHVMISTLRHEGSHALWAMAEGARITEFVFWPTTRWGFKWGYILYDGKTSWVVSAAPYLCDLLWYVLFWVTCAKVKIRPHWLWINMVILGLLGPLSSDRLKPATAGRVKTGRSC